MPTVLHLSDVHRTPDEPVTNDEILHGLVADLETHSSLGIAAPDIVILSGDLTQSAESDEYAEAEEFVGRLLAHLKLGADRLVLVPGNHDVHWPTSEEAFVLRKIKPAALDKDLIIPLQGEFLCARGEREYQERLAHFRNFYKRVKGVEYPSERKAQYTIHQFKDLKIAIAGLSSCDLNDHRRFRGRIHISAIAAAAEALSAFDGLRLAIWHHDLNWRGEPSISDCLDTDSLRQVSIRSFACALCGHTHRPASHNVSHIAALPSSSCVRRYSLRR